VFGIGLNRSLWLPGIVAHARNLRPFRILSVTTNLA
jgi:hypothetical protein